MARWIHSQDYISMVNLDHVQAIQVFSEDEDEYEICALMRDGNVIELATYTTTEGYALAYGYLAIWIECGRHEEVCQRSFKMPDESEMATEVANHPCFRETIENRKLEEFFRRSGLTSEPTELHEE